jgi:trehalose synthase
MWKGAAVIGGNVGGIKHQIEHGVSGYLVNNVDEAAACIVALVKDRKLRERMGRNARSSVRNRFLMTRLMEDWLDLIGSFEARFQLKGAAQR